MSIWYLYFNFHTFLSIVNFYIISISAIHVPHRFNDLGLALCPAVLEGRQQGKPGGAQEMGGEVLVEKARDSSSSSWLVVPGRSRRSSTLWGTRSTSTSPSSSAATPWPSWCPSSTTRRRDPLPSTRDTRVLTKVHLQGTKKRVQRATS